MALLDDLRQQQQQLRALLNRRVFIAGFGGLWEAQYQRNLTVSAASALKRYIHYIFLMWLVIGSFVLFFMGFSMTEGWWQPYLVIGAVLASAFAYCHSPLNGKAFVPIIGTLCVIALAAALLPVFTSEDAAMRRISAMCTPYGVIVVFTASRLPFRTLAIVAMAAGAVAFSIISRFDYTIDWQIFHTAYTFACLIGLMLAVQMGSTERELFLRARLLELEKEELQMRGQDYETDHRIGKQVAAVQEAIRTDGSPAELGRKVLSALAGQLPIHAGVMYLPDTAAQTLLPVAHYACRALPQHQGWGESLCGQAYLKGKPMVIDNLPTAYLHATSATGGTSAGSLYLWPVHFEGNIIALLELASIQPLSAEQYRLLERTDRSIAMATMAALSRQ